MPAAGYTGAILSAGKPMDRRAFMRRHLRQRHGIASAPAGRALCDLHELAINLTELNACLFDSPSDMHELLVLSESEGFTQRLETIRAAAATLAAAGKVKSRPAEYRAICLAGELAAMCFDQGRLLRQAYDLYHGAHTQPWQRDFVAGELDKVAKVLAEMLEAVDAGYKIVEAQWNRTRHRHDRKKAITDLDLPCKCDSLLGRLARARAFRRDLLKRLVEGTRAYRRGWPFPKDFPKGL